MKTARGKWMPLAVALAAMFSFTVRGAEPGPDEETREKRARFRQIYDEGNALYHGKHDEAGGLALFEQLERETRLADDKEWMVSGIWKVAQVHSHAGRLERGVELYEEARELIFNEPGTRPGTANHFLVLGNLCWNYERLGRMGMHTVRHGEAVEQARLYFARQAGADPGADPFAHDDETMGRLNNTGFIGQVFFREARMRFESGRTEEAIELATKLDRRLGLAPPRNHWERDLRARTRLCLLQWNDELGRVEERDRWENLLLVPEAEPGAGRYEWHWARLLRASRLHARGEDRAAQRALAEASLVALRATNHVGAWLEGHAMLARMLADEGNGAAALAVIDGAISRVAELQERLVRARLLLARAELRCDLGVGADAATWHDLREALEWLRSVGGLREEPRAFWLYARHLRLGGREVDARRVLGYAESRFARFFAGGRFVGARVMEQPKKVDAPSGNEGAVAQTEAEGTGDLQPIEIVSRVGEGDGAGARYTVTHAGAAAVEGVLHVMGAVAQAAWDDRALVWRVRLDDVSPVREVRQAVRLESLDQARIVLRRAKAGAGSPAVEVGWTVDGRRQTAWWRFAHDATARRAILRNDNLALANPFYAVPLHHLLDDAARAGGGIVNLRVRAEPGCRVEIVDDGSGDVLGVDAQGDGDFRGAGDVLRRDEDRDGHPDMRLPGAADSGVELYVYPMRQDTDVRIMLEARLPDGTWATQSADVVLGVD